MENCFLNRVQAQRVLILCFCFFFKDDIIIIIICVYFPTDLSRVIVSIFKRTVKTVYLGDHKRNFLDLILVLAGDDSISELNKAFVHLE